MNEIIKMGIILMLTGLVASLALALTNELTKAKIQGQQELKLTNSLKEIMDADNFIDKGNHYEAYKENKLVGRVLKVSVPGYSSIVKMLVGFDLENKIINLKVIEQTETPGLGTNVEKESFLGQFIGMKASDLKLRKDGGSIDAITGATITSRAAVNGIINTYGSAKDAVSSASKKK